MICDIPPGMRACYLTKVLCTSRRHVVRIITRAQRRALATKQQTNYRVQYEERPPLTIESSGAQETNAADFAS